MKNGGLASNLAVRADDRWKEKFGTLEESVRKGSLLSLNKVDNLAKGMTMELTRRRGELAKRMI